jgi:hypothetical protein
MSFYDNYRHVLRVRLWESIDRLERDPLPAHIQDAHRWSMTLCGQPTSKLTTIHVSIAKAIGARDCKSCLRSIIE